MTARAIPCSPGPVGGGPGKADTIGINAIRRRHADRRRGEIAHGVIQFGDEGIAMPEIQRNVVLAFITAGRGGKIGGLGIAGRENIARLVSCMAYA